METLQFIHSGWAYIVLLVLVIATFNALIKFFSGKEYSPVDFRFSLFALITMHIQLLIGIILFFSKGDVLQQLRSFLYVVQQIA